MQDLTVQQNTSLKILMIDDDITFFERMNNYLKGRGFILERSQTGPEGIAKIKTEDYHAIILDVMLSGADGFEVLKEIRRFSTVPVVILSAPGEEADRIVALEVGADDYLPKTFSSRELLARLRANIRRSQFSAALNKNRMGKIIIKELCINSMTREVTKNYKQISLTSLEFDLLYNLARSAGAVLSRNTLLNKVAGRDFDFIDRSIDVHISSLRRKLEDDSRNPRYIKTIRSGGYMFLSEDTESAASH